MTSLTVLVNAGRVTTAAHTSHGAAIAIAVVAGLMAMLLIIAIAFLSPHSRINTETRKDGRPWRKNGPGRQ